MIIKGKPVADVLEEQLKNKVKILNINGIEPKIAVVRVGNNSDDLSYIKGIVKRFNTIGIKVDLIELDVNISQDDYIRELHKLNNDNGVNGILCLRPLPRNIDENIVKHYIKPTKDIDCMNPINMAKLVSADTSGFEPCTAKAVIEILEHYDVNLTGKHVVVIGRSTVVGKPLSLMLTNKNATVTLCHSKTQNLKTICNTADIIIAAIGKAKMIDSTYIPEGAIVIDVGINVDEHGKLCGDVDLNDVVNKVDMITPVPGGVGAITTVILAKQLLTNFNVEDTYYERI